MAEAAAIGRLKAIEQLHLLKARRDRAADTKDRALYGSLHVPEKHDGTWLFTSRRLTYHHTRSSPGAAFPPRPATAATGH